MILWVDNFIWAQLHCSSYLCWFLTGIAMHSRSASGWLNCFATGVGWLLPGPPQFSSIWSLILQEASLGLRSWEGQFWERAEVLRYNVTSATFFWPKEVTRPDQIQGMENRLHLLIRGAAKSDRKGHGYREGVKNYIYFCNLPQASMGFKIHMI